MKDQQACELAFDQFLKNHEVFLRINEGGYPEISCEMILLEICITFYLLDEESREQFFNDMQKIKNKISNEIFEDEADLLDRVSDTMEAIRE